MVDFAIPVRSEISFRERPSLYKGAHFSKIRPCVFCENSIKSWEVGVFACCASSPTKFFYKSKKPQVIDLGLFTFTDSVCDERREQDAEAIMAEAWVRPVACKVQDEL